MIFCIAEGSGLGEAGCTADRAPLAQAWDPFIPPQRDDPYPIFARARREEPVFFSEVQQAWMVTRYDDVLAVASDPHTFSSLEATRPAAGAATLPPEVETVLAGGYPYEQTRPMVSTDPPLHSRLRKFTATALAKRVAGLEGDIRELVDALIDEFIHLKRGDLIDLICYPLPASVIMRLQGIPPADRDKVKRWSEDKVALQWGGVPAAEQVEHAHGFVAYQRYMTTLVEERRRAPRNDILSDLASISLDDEHPLTTPELVGQMMGLLTAGHETTTNLIAHALIHLLRQRDQWQILCSDHGLAANAVEETLRRDNSVIGFMRLATKDTEVGGVEIAKGDRLQLLYASANHDERKYEDPQRFEIRREMTTRHLAFGHGIHFCVGATLARVEARVTLETLARRMPTLELTGGQIAWRSNAAFRGPTTLPVRW